MRELTNAKIVSLLTKGMTWDENHPDCGDVLLLEAGDLFESGFAIVHRDDDHVVTFIPMKSVVSATLEYARAAVSKIARDSPTLPPPPPASVAE